MWHGAVAVSIRFAVWTDGCCGVEGCPENEDSNRTSISCVSNQRVMKPLRECEVDNGPQVARQTDKQTHRERNAGLLATAGNNTPTDRFQSRTAAAAPNAPRGQVVMIETDVTVVRTI